MSGSYPYPITLRQLEVLREVAKACATGVPPTLRELGDSLGIGQPNGVKMHLDSLRIRGLVDWQKQKARILRLTDLGRDLLTKLGGVR